MSCIILCQINSVLTANHFSTTPLTSHHFIMIVTKPTSVMGRWGWLPTTADFVSSPVPTARIMAHGTASCSNQGGNTGTTSTEADQFGRDGNILSTPYDFESTSSVYDMNPASADCKLRYHQISCSVHQGPLDFLSHFFSVPSGPPSGYVTIPTYLHRL